MAVLPPDPVFTLRNVDMSPVHSLAFHFLPGSLERLLAGSRNGFVYAYNLQTNRMQQKIKVGKTSILHLYHSDYTLVTQEKGGIVKFWQLSNSGYVEDHSMVLDHVGFCRFEVCPDSELLLMPSQDSVVNVYDLNGEKISQLKPEIEIKLGEVMCLKHLQISEKPYLLVGYESGHVSLWDLKSSQTISTTKLKECPMSIDYDLKLNRGVCGNTSENLQLFNISKSDLKLSPRDDIPIKNAGVNVVKIREDGKVFVSAGWDGRLRIFSWKSLRPLAVLTEHKSTVQDVIYSEEPVSMWKKNIMAAGGDDGIISLWDLYN